MKKIIVIMILLFSVSSSIADTRLDLELCKFQFQLVELYIDVRDRGIPYGILASKLREGYKTEIKELVDFSMQMASIVYENPGYTKEDALGLFNQCLSKIK